MLVITITDDKDRATGAVYGLLDGVLFTLGAPLANHDNVTFLRLPQAVFDNWQRAALTRLSNLKTFFG